MPKDFMPSPFNDPKIFIPKTSLPKPPAPTGPVVDMPHWTAPQPSLPPYDVNGQTSRDRQQRNYLAGFHMPRMPRMPKMPNYAKLFAEQQAQAAKAAGIKDRDTLYRTYMSSVDDAISFIDAQIKKESAAAALMGVDYDITDEMRQKRVSDYFATVWDDASQSQLEGLINKWGKPKGFKDFILQRGNPADVPGTTESKKETVATSKGQKPLPFDQISGEAIGSDNKSFNILNL